MLPVLQLQNSEAKSILLTSLIQPVLRQGWGVVAFRMGWKNLNEIQLKDKWDNIIRLRNEMDTLALSIPGCILVISGINSTYWKSKDNTYKTPPSVCYLIATQGEMRDAVAVYQRMNENTCGAIVKLMLQPYQMAESDIKGVLCRIVKDNIEGFVRRMVDGSSIYLGGIPREPIVKFFVVDHQGKDIVDQTTMLLNSRANFPVVAYDVMSN